MIIRNALLDDSEAIAAIWTENLGETPYNLTAAGESAIEAAREHIAKSDIRVACKNDTIVGFAIASVYPYIDGPRLWVAELHVSTQHRGYGAGRALLESFEHDYRQKGVLRIELLSHSAASAAEFYRHLRYDSTAYQKLEKKLN